jgi:hypothetical protein
VHAGVERAGRISALDATRSSNRSQRMARSMSVASGDSNWNTPSFGRRAASDRLRVVVA